jgi:hypothetical protein
VKPSAPPPADLDEVERALSALEGRHPQHERIRRETMAAAEERRREMEGELARNARRRILRGAIAALVLSALGAAGFAGWRLLGRARTIRSALDRDEAPFVTRGMKETASNELFARGTLEVDVPAASCLVAVSTAGAVRARQGAMAVEGARSAGWCTCEAGRAVVEGGDGGLAVLQIEARRTGGALARPWSDLSPSVWGDSGGECAEATLDAWIADHGWHGEAPDDRWLDAAPARVALKHAGFRAVSNVESGRPFAVVEAAAGDCLLAVATGDDDLSLRAPGGVRRISHARGAMAWCTNVAESTTVWREGRSKVVVLAVSAVRVGGLLGVRECAESASVHVATEAVWLRDEDLAWYATSLLRASGLAEVTTAELPLGPGAANTRVAALVRSPSAVVP